jgi:hypothetical protein
VTRYVVRLAAAVILAAAAGLGVPTPAQAASCSTAHGVTVVVDFHQLGGGARATCDLSGAGKNALTQLTDVGYQLTYAQRQPGFVCRVDGAPASDPCINTSPADAYWSVWWSDGKSGQWSFSSQGVGSLIVPAGGYVALSWQGGSDRAAPRIAPQPHPTASSTPSSSPTHAPSSQPASPATTTTATPTSAPTSPVPTSPTATPLRQHHHKRHHSSPPPSPATHAGAARASAPVEPADSGLPGWVAPGLVALVFAAAAAVVVVRRMGAGGR